MAPEIINGEPESQAVDVYSLGVVMWELVTGRRPTAFDAVSVRALERREGPGGGGNACFVTPDHAAHCTTRRTWASPDALARRTNGRCWMLENGGATCRSRVPPAVLALIRRCWARAPADGPSAANATQTLRGVVSASTSTSAQSVVAVGADVGAGVGRPACAGAGWLWVFRCCAGAAANIG